jgi:hypothetical protein
MKPSIRPEILARANYVCELCYGPLNQMSLHHRKPRQMGGTKVAWIHDHENLLALCGSGTTGCHGHVESRRRAAYDYGWLVRTGIMPHTTPFVDLRGHWWYLYKDLKLPLSPSFDTPNPSSTLPPRGVGSVETPREEHDDRPY